MKIGILVPKVSRTRAACTIALSLTASALLLTPAAMVSGAKVSPVLVLASLVLSAAVAWVTVAPSAAPVLLRMLRLTLLLASVAAIGSGEVSSAIGLAGVTLSAVLAWVALPALERHTAALTNPPADPAPAATPPAAGSAMVAFFPVRRWRARRARLAAERRWHDEVNVAYAALLLDVERRRRLWYRGLGPHPGPYLPGEMRWPR